RVMGLHLPEVVLEGDLVGADFQVASEGFDGERGEVTLTLLDSLGQPVSKPGTKGVELKGGGAEQSERIEFTPRQSGEFIARLEIAPFEGELFEENNRQEKSIRVLSQKIKVLYVEGPPRYEYRYLKNALILDPTMQSQCLLLSADPTFSQEASQGVPPLTAFPSTREELFEYHLVIVGDVPPDSPALPDQWQEWLVEFVDEIGGGVVFIAGQQMPDRYKGQPLERLFPVELEDVMRSPLENAAVREPFYPRRTPEGKEHPVMHFTGIPEKDALLWREVTAREHRGLPGFFWYARTRQLKRGGVALAVHGDPSEDHIKFGPRPLFAYQYFGRGRTFMSLVDGTWRWRKNVGNLYFYKFWGQVIRFTSLGRLLGKTHRFAISTDLREYSLGNQVRVLARALGPEFKPSGDAELSVYLARTEGESREPAVLTAVQVPAQPAFYEVTIEASQLGEHRLWLEERGEEVANTSFRVLVPQLEYEEPRMDEALLEQIAALSGGSYHRLPDAAKIPGAIPVLETLIPISSEQRPLWDTRTFLLLFAGVITLEWVLRKVFRLL
ncbi:MAG: hypothetical protein L0Z55_06535, partial [Planctomycetes bacterium]|nr:hypothetical protein [Planctomycetota bacterium]